MAHGGGIDGRHAVARRRRKLLSWLSPSAALTLVCAAYAGPPTSAPSGYLTAETLRSSPPQARQPTYTASQQPAYAAGPELPLEDPPGLEPDEPRGVANMSAFDAPHTAEMELVAQEADAHTRRGFELAGRRAYFSAREEFIQALRTLSQAMDVQHGTNAHSAALAAGMRALDEAKDFVPRGAGLEANLDVPMIVSAHQTPVYRSESLDGVTALVARQRYYTYAREQLGVCAGREVAGSMALHALGKLNAELSTEKREQLGGSDAEAMVYFQAALLAAPENHLAANDLGAMLARKGSWADAREWFLRSLAAHETAAAWTNLAKTHERLGEKDLAALAAREAELALKAESPGAHTPAPSTAVKVEWVAPRSMTAAAGEQYLNNNRPAEANPQAPVPAPTAAATDRSAQSWWPWKRNAPAK